MSNCKIKAPFFEIGPKSYLYGDQILDLAKAADAASEKYGVDTLNQFGASAYDCVYAIYNAMKEIIDAGEEIPVTISASDLSDLLKAKFTGGFTYSGVTGNGITWEESGYVAKEAVKYTLKTANA